MPTAPAARRRAARQAGSSISSSWAGTDDADGLDHTRPVAWATETGAPSVRM